MAVPEQTPYSEHTGNGVTTSFALDFQCETKDHLIVIVDEIEPPIATWSLTGGNVVFTTAPAAGKKITLQRNTPFSRTTDYQSYNNSFRPPAVNKDFDWIWWKLQELGVADWILSNRINDLRAYVDKQDNVLQDNIDSLKNYVDDKDDELRNYLLNAIQEQGVALDQLEEYYSYLMQQLAQVAIDRGWAASFIVSADGSTQQEINDFGGAKWRNKPLGYDIGSTVKLENGDIVKSTVAGNTVDPNIDMTGWILIGGEWVDITNLLIAGGPLASTWNSTVINNAIAKAKAEKKGVTCAPKGTVHAEGDLDFKFIQYIKFYSDILNSTGTVIVGGFSNTANPVDITFQRITNGTSAVADAIPTIDTFRCEGIKAGNVKIGQTNLLRIHAVGGDVNRSSNAYFAMQLGGSVRAFRVSDEGVNGWNNEFVVTGGRIVDLDVTGTGYVPNNIQFDNNVFEGALVKIRFKNAWTNRVTNARMENTAGSQGVIFESDTMQNTVICKWNGSGSPRGMFEFPAPVNDLGKGNQCTTQNAIEFDAVELFSVSVNSGIVANATSSACVDSRIGRTYSTLVNRNIIQPTLKGFIAESNKIIALSDMVAVQNGDAIKFDCDYDGALLRPIIAIYDENKQPITSGTNLISIAGALFAGAEGHYTTTADRTAIALQNGASVNSDLVKYIRVGCSSSVGGTFRILSAYLYTRKLLSGESKAMARSKQIIPSITGLPASGFVDRDTKLFETTSKRFLNCSASTETFTTTSTTGGTLTVKRTNGVSIDSIVGVLDSVGDTVWAKCLAVTSTTITLDKSVSVNVGAMVVSNKWDYVGLSPAEGQLDSTATTVAGLVADHNALLLKLKAAGLML